MKKTILSIKLLFVLLLFYYLAKSDYFDLTFLKIFVKNMPFIVFLIILSFTTMILATIRWWLILKKLNFDIKFKHTFIIVYIGTFFNNVLFGSYGGDLLRVYYIYNSSNHKKLFLSFTVLLDRFFGFIGLFIISVFSFLNISKNLNLFYSQIFLYILIFSIVIAMFVILSFLFTNRVNIFSSIINPINNLLKFFRSNLSVFFICVLISIILFSIVNIMVFLITVIIFDYKIDFYNIFLSNSLATFFNAIPLTPGGLGIGELTFTKINIYLSENSKLLNIANAIVLFRLVNLVVSLPGVIFYINYKKKLIKFIK